MLEGLLFLHDNATAGTTGCVACGAGSSIVMHLCEWPNYRPCLFNGPEET